MVAYPVLTRSSMIKEHEFDDVRYTMALLLAMGKCKDVTLRELVSLLKLDQRDMNGLIEAQLAITPFLFSNAVSDMLARFGSQMGEILFLPTNLWNQRPKSLRCWWDSCLSTAIEMSQARSMISPRTVPLIGSESDEFRVSPSP